MWSRELTTFIEERLGLQVQGESLFGSLQTFAAKRAKALNYSGADCYLQALLRRETRPDELRLLAAELSNGETHFFRGVVKPDAIGPVLQQLAKQVDRPLRIWSIGCSSGEEPYSLAIILRQLRLSAEILATDINPNFLELARRASYRDWSLRRVPESVLRRFFFANATGFQLREEITQMVEMSWHNIVDPQPPSPQAGDWDLVVMQNVLIYFTDDMIDRVLQMIGCSLHKNGWLFTGAADLGQALPASLRLSSIAGQIGCCAAMDLDTGEVAPAVVHHLPSSRVRERSTPDDNVDFKLAVTLIENREICSAVQLLERRLQRFPEDVTARITLGNLHLTQHRFEESLSCYRRVQQQQTDNKESYYFEGVTLRKMDQWNEAEKAFRRALFLDPEFWPASFLLAGVFGRLGKPDMQKREFRRTLLTLHKQPAAPLFQSCTLNLTPVEELDTVARICQERLG